MSGNNTTIQLCVWSIQRIVKFRDATIFIIFYVLENEILTYEDMVRVFPDPKKKRPIVLIGMFVYTFSSYFHMVHNYIKRTTDDKRKKAYTKESIRGWG